VGTGPAPAGYTQRSGLPETRNPYVGDGQWHRFGPQPAPATPASSPRAVPHVQENSPPSTHPTYVADGQWHHFTKAGHQD
jgi:hypothetical protein